MKAIKIVVNSPDLPKERIFTKNNAANRYLRYIKKYHPKCKIEISTFIIN